MKDTGKKTTTAANTKSVKPAGEKETKFSALEDTLGYQPDKGEKKTRDSKNVQDKAKANTATRGEERNPQREREKQEYSEDKLEQEPKLKDNNKGSKKSAK